MSTGKALDETWRSGVTIIMIIMIIMLIIMIIMIMIY